MSIKNDGNRSKDFWAIDNAYTTETIINLEVELEKTVIENKTKMTETWGTSLGYPKRIEVFRSIKNDRNKLRDILNDT